MAEIDVAERVLTAAGMEARGILAITQDLEVKARLISNTDAAVLRGCFGAPTMFVGDQMFFWSRSYPIYRKGPTIKLARENNKQKNRLAAAPSLIKWGLHHGISLSNKSTLRAGFHQFILCSGIRGQRKIHFRPKI